MYSAIFMLFICYIFWHIWVCACCILHHEHIPCIMWKNCCSASHRTWIADMEIVWLAFEVHMPSHSVCQFLHSLITSVYWEKSQAWDELLRCFIDDDALIQNNHESIWKAKQAVLKPSGLFMASAESYFKQQAAEVCTYVMPASTSTWME
jgi:hypothetical protein